MSESHEIEVLQAAPMSALQSITAGEIDMQVSTARRFPRSIARFKADALSMATLDEETAGACFYVLKREGKNIEGPGVRLAEIVASCWGNLRVESRIISDDGKFVVATGTCWDMERNVLVRTEVRRRITTRDGKRYSDDMVAVTANAASSIAIRNAIFKVVPSAYIRDVYEKARAVAVGNERTLEVNRANAFAYFAKGGITEARVLEKLGKPSVADVGIDDLTLLRGIKTAIQEGTTTWDEEFPAPQPQQADKATQAPAKSADKLRQKLTPQAPSAPQSTEAEAQAVAGAERGAEANADGPVCGVCGWRGKDAEPTGCPECKGVKP